MERIYQWRPYAIKNLQKARNDPRGAFCPKAIHQTSTSSGEECSQVCPLQIGSFGHPSSDIIYKWADKALR